MSFFARQRPSGRALIAGGLTACLLILSAFFFAANTYKQQHFRDSKIDEIIFYFHNGLANGQSLSFSDAARTALPWACAALIVTLLPLIVPWRRLLSRGAALLHRPISLPTGRWRYRLLYALALTGWSLWSLATSFGIPSYISAITQSSQLFEQHYIDPRQVAIAFPEQKRNLIHIYVESLENTVASSQHGGRAPQSLIPELEKLALDPANVSFSHQDRGLGGMLPAYGTTWTAAGITAQSAGVPLKDGFLGKDRNELGAFPHFLPGAYTSGQIMEKAGYAQSFLMGSDAAFGGRDKFLTQHGNYLIKDHPYAKQHGLVPPDYHVWWGFEDKKLFQFARDEATSLAQTGKPFNLQLLTADTHFTDGYADETCPRRHAHQYDNVHACSSRQIAAFVEWIRSQPFGANTTIVITGDHLGMQTSYYEEKIGQTDYQRTIYNVIINPAIRPVRSQPRQFTSFDMYPTILAATGATIPGDRLGLGVNLFSARQTLVEQLGSLDALNQALSKRSHYYERRIMIPSS